MIIKEDFEIKNYTTYKIGGKVKKVYFPETGTEFVNLLKELDKYVVLGSCSNIIFSSNGYDGNIILTTELKQFEIKDSKIKVAAGVKGPFIAQKTAEAGLSGFEFMIGFPGSIGGNICMNASAHGQCISDNLIRVSVFNRETKEIEVLKRDKLEFSYRHSVLSKGKYILLDAEFELKKGNTNEIKKTIAHNLEFRRNIQPSLAYPNAGSVFKNPVNNSAGKLLDEAGAKSFDIGNVKVWDNHANFIVNKGDATSEEVLSVMEMMYNAVKNKFDIELKPEIIFIGNKTEKEEKIWNLFQKTQE